MAGRDDSAATQTSGINFDETESADGGDETAGKLDMPAGGGLDGGCDPSGEGDEDYSFIWISNSDEGTVSKVDTSTGTELGRYWACPDESACDPSRTSVNLAGDVAVSIREPGGITKVAAIDDNCVDANGDGLIQTSSGPGDVLPWGTDECVLWHTEIPSSDQYSGPAAHGVGPRHDRRCGLGLHRGAGARVGRLSTPTTPMGCSTRGPPVPPAPSSIRGWTTV